MKIIRCTRQNETVYAELIGEKVYPIVGKPYEKIEKDGREWALSEVKLLAPAEPTKIVAVGDNYLDHIKEMNDAIPEEPVIFLKPNSAILNPGETIIYPARSSRVDYEAELALVIGKKCKNVEEKDADQYIFGYTALNDVTARDLQPIDGQWIRAKGFDTFAPFGPCINTEVDPEHTPVQSFLNNEIRQDGNSETMMRGARKILAFVSSVMTLEPGDIISLGTPKGVGPMQKGDKIEIRVGGIGSLINYVG